MTGDWRCDVCGETGPTTPEPDARCPKHARTAGTQQETEG